MGKRAGDRGTTVEAPAVIDLADTRLRCVTVHGYRRAYRMVGTGPVLLLLHGIGDSSESWLPVLSALARHHTVVAPDLLGHGASDKPRADYAVAAYANGMRDLLDVLGSRPPPPWSATPWAAGWPAQLAYQFPERCERLVLVAARERAPTCRPCCDWPRPRWPASS
jgi:pimeloyl-ACP methyl ester carboxylesterase